MTIEDILRAEAADVQSVLDDHDPQEFTRRLAQRIAEQERLTTASRVAGKPDPERGPGPRRPGRAHPLPRRQRPRPLPGETPGPDELRRQLQQLCEAVLRCGRMDRLVKFAHDYDAIGARTFACLLYSTHRRPAAVFWWRFAAGAGDQLAAHCLSVHHAADGSPIDARLWRTIATAMGYSPTRHLPNPAPGAPLPDRRRALDRTLEGPTGTVLREFVEEEAEDSSSLLMRRYLVTR
ncbi:hypothetical protein [Streptomyces syringium]|uniref:hypothetical protein n=1 Tax=Streptomyces syringium TaxID=76729 RepID=UPI0033B83BE4